jgi:hypothetical protein
MPAPNILHELKTLVRSMHPVVVLETIEEERSTTCSVPWRRSCACRCSRGPSCAGCNGLTARGNSRNRGSPDAPSPPRHAHGRGNLPSQGPRCAPGKRRNGTRLPGGGAIVHADALNDDLSGVPPELLRKGRFDEIFFVDLPSAAEREAIFGIHLRMRRHDPDAFDLASLAHATEGYSGAEIEQAIVSSLYRALHEQQPLTTSGLMQEIEQTSPLSVSRREDIERVSAMPRGAASCPSPDAGAEDQPPLTGATISP